MRAQDPATHSTLNTVLGRQILHAVSHAQRNTFYATVARKMRTSSKNVNSQLAEIPRGELHAGRPGRRFKNQLIASTRRHVRYSAPASARVSVVLRNAASRPPVSQK